MRFQKATSRELTRIAAGTLILTGIMLAVFGLLASLGAVSFTAWLALSAAGGAVVAILNFGWLCLTVQAVAEDAQETRAKARMRVSYHARLMMQALWCILVLAIEVLHPVAGLLPLLFPRLTILFFQATGVYTREAYAQHPKINPEDAEDITSSQPRGE